jgi:prepilin-type N-terminal cleavage/methylation domain-containing protein
MAMKNSNTLLPASAGETRQKGFSLIEFLVAMAIVMIGLVGLLALFSHAVVVASFSEDAMIAKQKAREALESVFTARNTQQIVYDQIRNVGSGGNPDGIFLSGFQPMYLPTASGGTGNYPGLVGVTGEHGTIETVMISKPGQTPRVVPLDTFERQITITNLTADLRQIDVTIRYRVKAGMMQDYTVSSYISRFR